MGNPPSLSGERLLDATRLEVRDHQAEPVENP
jgi:hypothetical protein